MREKCVVTNRGVFLESSSMAKDDFVKCESVVEGSEKDTLIKTRIRELCEKYDPANFYVEMRKLVSELRFNLIHYADYDVLCDYLNKNNDALREIIINENSN